MKLDFAGTPEFAAGAGGSIDCRHEIALVLTQLDRPAGRGMKLTPARFKTTGAATYSPVRRSRRR